jgi:hypothetical protein
MAVKKSILSKNNTLSLTHFDKISLRRINLLTNIYLQRLTFFNSLLLDIGKMGNKMINKQVPQSQNSSKIYQKTIVTEAKWKKNRHHNNHIPDCLLSWIEHALQWKEAALNLYKVLVFSRKDIQKMRCFSKALYLIV